MPSSNLLMARKASKGNVTATEAASTNTVVIPPGLYDVEIISPLVPTGTTQTCSVEIMDSNGGAYASLVDQRIRSVSPTLKDRWFLRGVRIVRWAAGAANVGVALTVTGTTPVFGPVEVVFWPLGTSQAWNGTP